ncbi:MAG: ARPP-1 family domain-containing protein [Solirubrobacterales bacterium]
MNTNTQPLMKYVGEPLRAGNPDVSGPLAVFPLFGRAVELKFLSFVRGREHGVVLREMDGGASVNDLVVRNTGDVPVLLYEGEEVLGAQQNRTFDVSVLVLAKAECLVPVSCVEAGRWDGSRHGEELHSSPHAAYPELRHAKNRHARQLVAAGMVARADQAQVWSQIESKSARHGVTSPTNAMSDVYASRYRWLRELKGSMRPRDGQLGALVAIGGRFVVLDWVGRDDVFADLFDPLLQGYGLDALEAEERTAPSTEDAQGFVDLVLGTDAAGAESIGLGLDLRFAADGVAGCGLATDGELLQLTAFPEDGESGRSVGRSGRVRRPSQRRR